MMVFVTRRGEQKRGGIGYSSSWVELDADPPFPASASLPVLLPKDAATLSTWANIYLVSHPCIFLNNQSWLKMKMMMMTVNLVKMIMKTKKKKMITTKMIMKMKRMMNDDADED